MPATAPNAPRTPKYHPHAPATAYGAPRFAPGRANQPIAKRAVEFAALRPDGSLMVGQDHVPALPLFNAAFSAFARGTIIETTQGGVAVEDLQPGDMLPTSSGEPAKLVWIGSSSFVPASSADRTPLVRVMADSFGPAHPSTFVTFGPGARMLRTPDHLRSAAQPARVLNPVRDFIDGVNVIDVVPQTPVRLFHLCLTRHAAIRASGLEVETFHPGSGTLRALPAALRKRFLDLFPMISQSSDFGPLAHPRAPEPQGTQSAPALRAAG